MNLDRVFEDTINEVAVKNVTPEEGQYKLVIKDGNGVKEFLFKHHRYNALRNELKKSYGDKLVEKIIVLTKKLDSANFKDEKVDINIDGEKATLAEDVLEEKATATAEMVGAIKGGKYVPSTDKWSGTLGKDVISKLKAFIHKRYGLDKIAGKDDVPDVEFYKDNMNGKFIINFETPAKDPLNGKPVKRAEVSQARILSGK